MIILALILAIVIIVIRLCISWISVCGFIKLLSLCFGFKFSWGVSTGVWLMICGLKGFIETILSNNDDE